MIAAFWRMLKILIYSFLIKIVVLTAFQSRNTYSICSSNMGESLQPKNVLNVVDALQMETFGDWNEPNFPRPALPNEAGNSPSGQRRYLWYNIYIYICIYIYIYIYYVNKYIHKTPTIIA
jgi:hypothetical protein